MPMIIIEDMQMEIYQLNQIDMIKKTDGNADDC